MGLLSIVIESLENARISDYVNVVSVALASYDFLLTFADEVRLIWPSKWGDVKMAFFLTRYSLCSPLFKATYSLSFFGILTSEFLMMIRVYAIWGRRKDVIFFLTVVFLAAAVISVIFLRKLLLSVVFTPSPIPTLVPCVVTSIELSVYIDFVMIILVESVAIVIYEDNLRYFVCMFAASVANLVVVRTASIGLAGLLFELQRVLHSILSARMIMHIREAVEPQPDVCTVSTLAFTNASKERSRVDNDMSEVPRHLESGISDDA
ncbi:hypothetical protein DFH11DRAFT_15195 [Phellopilus nigrolimitatus]|nr:hypothetical protein DFH11DRAFT_15195 [Phellopilus nigrolimitatus]